MQRRLSRRWTGFETPSTYTVAHSPDWSVPCGAQNSGEAWLAPTTIPAAGRARGRLKPHRKQAHCLPSQAKCLTGPDGWIVTERIVSETEVVDHCTPYHARKNGGSSMAPRLQPPKPRVYPNRIRTLHVSGHSILTSKDVEHWLPPLCDQQ